MPAKLHCRLNRRSAASSGSFGRTWTLIIYGHYSYLSLTAVGRLGNGLFADPSFCTSLTKKRRRRVAPIGGMATGTEKFKRISPFDDS